MHVEPLERMLAVDALHLRVEPDLDLRAGRDLIDRYFDMLFSRLSPRTSIVTLRA